MPSLTWGVPPKREVCDRVRADLVLVSTSDRGGVAGRKLPPMAVARQVISRYPGRNILVEVPGYGEILSGPEGWAFMYREDYGNESG